MAEIRVLAAATIFGAALIVSGSLASWAQEDPSLKGCNAAVGTFLTKSFKEGASGDDYIARSLFSLTNGGHAFFTDSGQRGEAGYRPFSDGRGAWRCVSGADGKSRFQAVILDFVFKTEDDQSEEIGRLDFDAVVDDKTGKLESRATLYFVPLGANPMHASTLGEGQKFELVGEKIAAP